MNHFQVHFYPETYFFQNWNSDRGVQWMPPIKVHVWTLGKISDDIRWMKFWENGIQGKWPEHFIMKVKKHIAEKPLFSLTLHR